MPKALPATFRLDGERLRAHREAQGWTREDIAVRVRCSASLVAHVELGYHSPSVDKAASIVAAYGLRLDDVIVPVEPDEPEAVAR